MAWIPEKHAVIERFLRLTEAGVSEDGWEVLRGRDPSRLLPPGDPSAA